MQLSAAKIWNLFGMNKCFERNVHLEGAEGFDGKCLLDCIVQIFVGLRRAKGHLWSEYGRSA
jgi:hypothetical protein